MNDTYDVSLSMRLAWNIYMNINVLVRYIFLSLYFSNETLVAHDAILRCCMSRFYWHTAADIRTRVRTSEPKCIRIEQRWQLLHVISYSAKFRIHHSDRKNELSTNCRARGRRGPEIPVTHTALDAHWNSMYTFDRFYDLHDNIAFCAWAFREE